MQKKSLCFLVAIVMILAASIVTADDDIRVISGHVIEIDPVGSILVVSYLDDKTSTLVNIQLYVPEDAVLLGGTETLMLDDVQVSDRVEIEFTGDPLDNPEVKRLIDMDRTNW